MSACCAIVGILSCLDIATNIAQAQTGKCIKASEQVKEKSWAAINYKYSPQYIADNRASLEATVNGAVDTFHRDCDKATPSDEQIIAQNALDLAAKPIKESADTFLKGMGLPPLGDKALHIDIKDIERHGIFGGPNSVFRKPFG
jgi:hypothetical protein